VLHFLPLQDVIELFAFDGVLRLLVGPVAGQQFVVLVLEDFEFCLEVEYLLVLQFEDVVEGAVFKHHLAVGLQLTLDCLLALFEQLDLLLEELVFF
jgi:hypothetical protein